MASHSSLRIYWRRITGLLLLLPVLLLAEEDTPARFDMALVFDPQLLGEVNIELFCNSGQPQRQQIRVTGTGSRRLELRDFKNNNTICQLRALLEDGYSAEYQSESDGEHSSDEHGCHFKAVSTERDYRCQIKITQNPVSLTVYKKWIGGTGKEAHVEIYLECAGLAFPEPRFVNEKSPQGWEVGEIDADGIRCDVFETPEDTFIADQSDCTGLMLFPARGAECTLVNTKVVKRIEMLNRYGKAIMILVMLVAGLIAVKRYV